MKQRLDLDILFEDGTEISFTDIDLVDVLSRENIKVYPEPETGQYIRYTKPARLVVETIVTEWKD